MAPPRPKAAASSSSGGSTSALSAPRARSTVGPSPASAPPRADAAPGAHVDAVADGALDSACQSDRAIYLLYVFSGLTFGPNMLSPAAHVAGYGMALLSAVLAAAAGTPAYRRHRDAVAVAFRLAIPPATQLVVAGVARHAMHVPPPGGVATWVRWALGRTSPILAALLALSARLPSLHASCALAAAMAVEYAALQRAACAAIPLSARGVDAYFVGAAGAVSAAVARVVAAVALPGAVEPPRPTPCAPSACFAVMTLLHVAALALGTLVASPAARASRDGWVAAVAGLHCLWCVLDATALRRAPCPRVPPHPLAALQDAKVGLGVPLQMVASWRLGYLVRSVRAWFGA